MPIKNCRACGKEFSASNPAFDCCSKECRQAITQPKAVVAPAAPPPMAAPPAVAVVPCGAAVPKKDLTATNSAAKRLMSEWMALRHNPLIGGNAAPVGDDLFRWKLIVVGPAPYDFPIRIELVYPEDYPVTAPKAFFETPIMYTGGATLKVDGRLAVCLNIFGNFAFIHTEWKDESAGWTPGYTIETIIVSLQGLLMDSMLSQERRDVDIARRAALAAHCSVTGHIGSDRTKWFPKVAMTADEVRAMSEAPAGDAVGAAACPAVVDPVYVCYVTKTSPDVLGFGINLDNPRSAIFSSPCEYMGLDAFDGMGVRRSSLNKPLMFWLPMMTPMAPTYGAIEAELHRRLSAIMAEARIVAPRELSPQDQRAVSGMQIITSVMSTLVVEIMNAKNNLSANDKFVGGYFAFLALLRGIARRHPCVVQIADKRLSDFIGNPSHRSKQSVPNLGDFLLLLAVSSHYTWADLSDAFVQECDARNVFWYLVGNRQSPGTLGGLRDEKAPDRAALVFSATAVSRGLVCYQVQFIKLAAVLSGGGDFVEVPEAVKDCVKGIYSSVTGMRTWKEHMAWLGMPWLGDEHRSKQLVAAMRQSAAARYHS